MSGTGETDRQTDGHRERQRHRERERINRRGEVEREREARRQTKKHERGKEKDRDGQQLARKLREEKKADGQTERQIGRYAGIREIR